MHTQAAAQIGAGYIKEVEAPRELDRLESNLLDVISQANEAAIRLEQLADRLGLYDAPEAGSVGAGCPPEPSGIVSRLHDRVTGARYEVSRIHRAFDRLCRLA